MNIHDATKQAYKRGYEDGKQDAMKPIENDKVMERLTEILRNGILAAMDDDNRYLYTDVVDYMMAHGVTVATDNNVGDKSSPTINVDTCVCCGAIIPEGQMVCPNCLVTVKEG